MGGWINLIICLVPVYLLYRSGQTPWMILAVVNAVANFWSFGVMHNYAVEAKKSKVDRLRQNMALEGRLNEEAESRLNKLQDNIDPESTTHVPNWITTINILTFVIGISLIVYAVFSK